MSSTNLKQKAKSLVLDTYGDSRNFYSAHLNELNNLWKLSVGEPLKAKKKKFNRFIPYIPAAIDLILPRLAGRLPIYQVTGRTEDDHPHANSMEKVVEYFLDQTKFHEFEIKYIHKSVVYGTILCQIGWKFEQKPGYKDRKPIIVDRPEYTIIPPENVFPHRKKISIQDEWPIIIRSEVSRRDLQADPNLDKAVLGQLGAPMGSDEEFFDSINRSRPQSMTNTNDNIGSDKGSDIFVKLEYWGKFDVNNDGVEEECVITLINGELVARLEQNPFWHQRKPFAKLDFSADAHRFFNEGLVKQNWELQLELNDVRNTRSEARNIALKTPLMVDRGAGVNTDVMTWENSAIWSYDSRKNGNNNPIQPVTIPSHLLELDREEVAVKGDLQVRSGINDVIIGQKEVGVTGGDTATGASLAAEQTTLRFRTQGVLIDEAIKEIGEQTVSNIQQFVDRDVAFKIAGDPRHGDKFTWTTYKPDEMRQFEFDFEVTPMSTIVEPKAAKRERLIALKKIYDQDPRIDQDMLDAMILEAFDMDPQRILKSQEEQAEDNNAMILEDIAQKINDPSFATLPPEEQEALAQQLQQLQGGMNAGSGSPEANPGVLPPDGGGAGTLEEVAGQS